MNASGETLYNGIVLPEVWPPRDVDEGGTAPVPVPYLDDPPEVICIDLGQAVVCR